MFELRRVVVDGELYVGTFPYGTTAVVCLLGELDRANVGTAEEVILWVLDADFEVIIVDLQELEFMDSSGIALMASLARDVDAERLHVVPSKAAGVSRIMAMTGADSLLTSEGPAGWLGAQAEG